MLPGAAPSPAFGGDFPINGEEFPSPAFGGILS
jgi:hypothetical protein